VSQGIRSSARAAPKKVALAPCQTNSSPVVSSSLDLIHPPRLTKGFPQVIITGSSNIMPGHMAGRVAEHVLDPLGVPSLEPAFEDSRGVPEQLRIQMDAGSLAAPIENFGQAVRGERASIESQEEFTVFRFGTPAQYVGSQGCHCGLVEAQELLPSNFPSGHHQVAIFDIHMVELETDELAGAERDIEDHDNDGFVPGAGWRVDIDGSHQLLGLVEGNVRWELILYSRCRQAFHGAGRDDLLPDEPVKESPECSEVRVHRDIGQFSCGMVTGRVSFPFWLLPEPAQKIDDVFPPDFLKGGVDAEEAQELSNCHFRASDGGRAAVENRGSKLAVVVEGFTESRNGHAEIPSVPVSLLSPLSRGTRAYFIFRAVSIRPSIVANSIQMRKWFPYSGGHFGRLCLC